MSRKVNDSSQIIRFAFFTVVMDCIDVDMYSGAPRGTVGRWGGARDYPTASCMTLQNAAPSSIRVSKNEKLFRLLMCGGDPVPRAGCQSTRSNEHSIVCDHIHVTRLPSTYVPQATLSSPEQPM